MAVKNAVIQVRRGPKDELQIDKLLPGELAVATDAPILWFCWALGRVEQVATSENITEVIEEIVYEYLKNNPVTGITDIYMRVSDGYIQYSSDNKNWENLIALTEITGEKGNDGKNAYQYAQDGGYTGTETDFAEKLAKEYPSKMSDLENDSGFITRTASDLANYYLKSETYSRAEINQKLSAIPKFSIEVVSNLPLSGSSETVYLLKSGDEESNLYTEYIYVDGKWEYLGTQTVDLSGYALKDDVPVKLSDLTNDTGYITKTVNDLVNYYSKTETDNTFAKKANTLAGYGITDAATSEQFNKLSQEIVDQHNAEQDTAILGAELVTASGWTLGAGWSGSLSSGFTHASGNTEPLTFTPAITAGGLYQVTFNSSVAMTTTNLFVQVGNSAQFNLYGDKLNDGTISIGVLAVDTTGLVFTPESTFTGTLTNISIKEITGSYEAVQQYFDTNEAVSLEIHVTPRGLENVFIGQATGEMNTTGRENVGIGVNVLARNTSGFWNVGIGKDCLMNNIGGSRNLAIGYNALRNNAVGQRNVALGTFAMTQMEDGNWNIAIGSDSMNEATGGNRNVAVGFNTLVHNTGDNNVALGADSLTSNTTGYRNIAIGQGALDSNTTGYDNVCIGYQAGTAITKPAGNIAVGWAALYKLTTGPQNTAIGYGAGKSLTTGRNNILIGANVEADSATGNYQLNIGDLLKGSLVSGSAYLLLNGGLRLPNIPTTAPGNDGVYAEEWTFTLEDGSTVTKKVLLV